MPDSESPKRVAVAIELHWNLPWHLDCYQGIMDYGKEQGWACVTDPYLCGISGDGDLSSYDGVLGRINQGMADRVKQADVPGVTFFYEVDLHSVRSDSRGSARLVGEHLLACGYRRLAMVGDVASSPRVRQAIFRAFADAVTQLGAQKPIEALFNADDLSSPERSGPIRQAIAQWVQAQDKPIGLYVMDQATARYTTQICEPLGIRVPEDVGIVVHNTDKLTATSITPTLTEVAIDHWEQGYQAAAVLDKLMGGEPVDPKTRYITNPRIITRESSDRFISDDELVSKAMRHIGEHVRQAVTAEDIADALAVSRRTLDRRFEAVVGKTLSQEIVGRRIRELEIVLADLFGFGSASQFTQFFKKHTGRTPTAYRKRHKKEQ